MNQDMYVDVHITTLIFLALRTRFTATRKWSIKNSKLILEALKYNQLKGETLCNIFKKAAYEIIHRHLRTIVLFTKISCRLKTTKESIVYFHQGIWHGIVVRAKVKH